MKPDAIVLHHSFTKDQQTKDWDAIRRYHTSWRFNGNIISPEQAQQMISQGRKVEAPWSDIGYHYGVEQVGFEYLVIAGRPEDIKGAHCSQNGMNSHSLGICFVGNFDLAPPPYPQWQQGLTLVANLCRRYYIPVTRIYGHRDFAQKTCPGTQFSVQAFCMEVHSLL